VPARSLYFAISGDRRRARSEVRAHTEARRATVASIRAERDWSQPSLPLPLSPFVSNPKGVHRYQHWRTNKGDLVIVLGVVLLLIGFIAKIPILWSIGILVLVVGLILLLLGAMGRAVGGRKHYY
jgi:hypothetical protein